MPDCRVSRSCRQYQHVSAINLLLLPPHLIAQGPSCLMSSGLRPLASRLAWQAIEKRMRQATAAAEAARGRATAANGSLTDLWGAAMATHEAARCTAAEVRTLQAPSSAACASFDVSGHVVQCLCSPTLQTCHVTIYIQPAVARACQRFGSTAERSTDDAASAHLLTATLLQSAVLRHTQMLVMIHFRVWSALRPMARWMSSA